MIIMNNDNWFVQKMIIVIKNNWSVQKRIQDSQPPRRNPPQASRPCEEREEYPEGAPRSTYP